MKVKPLRNEFRPAKPVFPWVQPPDTFRYKVKTGDTWETLAERNAHEFAAAHLIWINFQLSPLEHRYTDKVNWYLREYVGCRHSHDGGRNWAFTDDADPGYIFLPHITYKMDDIAITGSPGLGGVDATKFYDDQNWYDILKLDKVLDIYGAAELGIGTLEIAVPLLLEAGMIVTGTLASIVGPAVAIGGAHDEALKNTSRGFFFTGFCSTFVMAADGWSPSKVLAFYPPWQHPPVNSVYQEKRETFRVLYNLGLKAGLLQARRLNKVDIRNLFVQLRSKLTQAEAQEYSGTVKDWPESKKKNYYGRLASILKQVMIGGNALRRSTASLQVKFR